MNLYVLYTFHFPQIPTLERTQELKPQEAIFPGKYAVYTACFLGKISLVKALIQHSADINEKYKGYSSIQIAIFSLDFQKENMLSIIKILLMNGVYTGDITAHPDIVPRVLRYFDDDLQRLFFWGTPRSSVFFYGANTTPNITFLRA